MDKSETILSVGTGAVVVGCGVAIVNPYLGFVFIVTGLVLAVVALFNI